MSDANTELRVIPFQVNAREYSVFVVLQDANLERMRAYDPAEIPMQRLGPEFTGLRLKDVIIGYATDADIHEVERLARQGEIRDVLRFLSRGFAFRPDQGDHDGPPKLLER